MTKLIKKSETPRIKYFVGDQVEWSKIFHDGRSYESITFSGEVIKVCPVNLHVKDSKGNIYSVNRETEARKIK
jgi:hypothetical protein